MTIKHGHHPADVDRPGSDSWRHFNEGRAERTLMVSPTLRVLFERSPDDYDPIGLARRYMDGADLVLVEGFKRAPLPKIEVFRTAVHQFVMPLVAPHWYVHAVTASAVLWSLGFGVYAVRYGPFLLRPRVDGKPG